MGYDGLRRLAWGLMRRERPGPTGQPTALVHEALLPLPLPDALHAGQACGEQLCEGPCPAGSLGRPAAGQSPATTSPPARVLRACRVARGRPSRAKRTEPSAKPRWAPPP